MSTVEPSLAGPKRPQDRIHADKQMKDRSGRQDLTNVFDLRPTTARDSTKETMVSEGGPAVGSATATLEAPTSAADGVEVEIDGEKVKIRDGHVVIAAITSCTNTSNPSQS